MSVIRVLISPWGRWQSERGLSGVGWLVPGMAHVIFPISVTQKGAGGAREGGGLGTKRKLIMSHWVTHTHTHTHTQGITISIKLAHFWLIIQSLPAPTSCSQWLVYCSLNLVWLQFMITGPTAEPGVHPPQSRIIAHRTHYLPLSPLPHPGSHFNPFLPQHPPQLLPLLGSKLLDTLLIIFCFISSLELELGGELWMLK
jgi:hypothetical protein